MSRWEAVVMGCSAGGLQALKVVLASFRPRRPVPVLVVCHTASDDLTGLSQLLSTASHWPVREAREREPAEAGVVQLAPSGYHLLVEPDRSLSLSIDKRVNFVRPSIDVLFESSARCFSRSLIGVIMTGANHDGADGLRTIRRCGGLGVVQTPATAESPVMPEAAIAHAGADHISALDQIGPLLSHLIDFDLKL